ncbi:MAG: hypothetical protein WC519_01110 [Parcubacteria group bacterium]
MKPKIIALLITISGILIFSYPVLADVTGESSNLSDCTIDKFSFDKGITPERFQNLEHFTDPATWCDFLQIASNVIGMLYMLVFPLAILMIIAGGIILVTAGGNESRITKGKKFISAALIGIAVAVGAGVILGAIIKGLGVTDTSLMPWLF